jgi:dihydroorotase/N-acyl-D-amino-acid deacylase
MRLAISFLPLFLLALTVGPAGMADARAADDGQTKTVRVAGIVLKWIRTDKAANYRRAEAMIREAAKGGAKLVCTTECFLDGYAIADKSIPLDEYRALGEPIPDGPYFQKLSRLADELNIHLIAGMLEADGEERFNTAVLIDPRGQLVGRYHKQQLGHESVRNTAGKESFVFGTPFGKTGMMICADRRYPDLVGRFRERGADFLICPSGGMFGPKRNDPIVQARSRENRRYIIFVHPAEFLVTGPDGSIVQRTILGDRLLVAPDEVGTHADSKRVFYFDLPLTTLAQPTTARTPADKKNDGPVEILIRGGTVIDGTGRPGVVADVAIKRGRISAVGKLKDTKATQVIDATGQVVCPGFIDLHSHADRGLLEHRAAENYIRQGVTTLLCGNCGSSPTDVSKFFEHSREAGIGPNVALLIGHGSVRQQVMGVVNRPPTPKELEAMRSLVRQAMHDGAVGMSTSLRYGSGAFASTEEIVALAREIAPFGGFYATHMRDEGTRILEAVEEALDIGRQAGVPVHIAHHKISSASVFGLTRQTLARIDQARAAGRDVTLDQYPYGAGSGGLSLYVPLWSLSGGLKEFEKRLTDPKTRIRILAGVKELLLRKIYEADHSPDNPAHTAKALSRIRIARARHDASLEGKTLTQILREREQTISLDNGCELLVELIRHGTGGINHTLEDRPGGDVDRVMLHPQTCIGSDGSVFEFGSGSPHPRSYGCFPRVLGHYVRERKLLTLEQAIHKMTQLPASRLGWTDRGRIAAGQWADVVVFDPQTVTDQATFAEPHRHSTGISEVIIFGRRTLAGGKMTGNLPGRPVTLERPESGENRVGR